MSQYIILKDDGSLFKECRHDFKLQADVKVEGIVYDIFFCSHCLAHAKKERPCPLHLPKAY